MATFFVLYDPRTREFAKAGRNTSITYSMNLAKHFTTEWSAKTFRSNHDLFSCFIVKKIQRY